MSTLSTKVPSDDLYAAQSEFGSLLARAAERRSEFRFLSAHDMASMNVHRARLRDQGGLLMRKLDGRGIFVKNNFVAASTKE